MTMIAYAFLQPQPSLPAVRQLSLIAFFDRQLSHADIAEDESVKNSSASKSAKVVLEHLGREA